MHGSLKLLQGPPLGAATPPDGKPEAGTEAPVSTRPRTGMPSKVSWPVMGGPTAHPTGVTLALGDPPRSLNAPGGSLGYLPGRGVQGPVPLVVLAWFPVPVGVVSAAAMYGRGSCMQSSLPHHRGSIEGVSDLAAGVEGEGMASLRHNQSMESGQRGTRVAGL